MGQSSPLDSLILQFTDFKSLADYSDKPILAIEKVRLFDWIAQSKPKEQCIYYIGTAIANTRQGRSLHNIIHDAYNARLVYPFQRRSIRNSIVVFEYLVYRSSAPFKPEVLTL